MINPETKFLGLVGYPVKHSLSPRIHNFLFKKYSVNAAYGCFEVRNLKEAVSGLRSLSFAGLNVTIPYKEDIIEHLDRIDPLARRIGAVNTVKFSNGKLTGFNTDGRGFMLSLKQFNWSVFGKRVFIAGAGGAAKAVAMTLAVDKPEFIGIYDINIARARELAGRVKEEYPGLKSVRIDNIRRVELNDFDLLINATGIGLKKKDPLVFDPARCGKGALVYDLIYNPEKTRLLEKAKARGLMTINGLWMLIWQALEAQKIWFGIDAEDCAGSLYRILTRSLKQ